MIHLIWQLCQYVCPKGRGSRKARGDAEGAKKKNDKTTSQLETAAILRYCLSEGEMLITGARIDK